MVANLKTEEIVMMGPSKRSSAVFNLMSQWIAKLVKYLGIHLNTQAPSGAMSRKWTQRRTLLRVVETLQVILGVVPIEVLVDEKSEIYYTWKGNLKKKG